MIETVAKYVYEIRRNVTYSRYTTWTYITGCLKSSETHQDAFDLGLWNFVWWIIHLIYDITQNFVHFEE